MANGIVRWFNSTKGYGFIESHDGSADVFVTREAVQQAGMLSLNGGQAVQYDVEPDHLGKWSAIHLKAESLAS
jgi:cold shock protein